MSELFPVLIGALVGLVGQRIAHPRRRFLMLIVVSTVAGFTASWISGELLISWAFLFVDMPLVFLAAIATTLILVSWQRWQVLQ